MPSSNNTKFIVKDSLVNALQNNYTKEFVVQNKWTRMLVDYDLSFTESYMVGECQCNNGVNMLAAFGPLLFR